MDDETQNAFLGFAGGIGVCFIGDDVTTDELMTWSLGGMSETGRDASGKA